MKVRLIFVVLLLLMAGVFLVQYPRSGRSVRPLSFEQLLREIEFASKPVLIIHFWATWCEPCRHEFPVWVDLIRESDGSKVAFLLISADLMEDREQVERFLAPFKTGTFIIEGATQDFLTQLSDEWTGALPATFIFNRDEGWVDFWEGGLPADALRRRVRRSYHQLQHEESGHEDAQ
ncbi:thioredoxin domain-containing protein [Verrucomicrobiota bacterium]